MQLALSFVFLASLLVSLSVLGDVALAVPTKRDQLVTLPLKRIHNTRDSNLHPQVVCAEFA